MERIVPKDGEEPRKTTPRDLPTDFCPVCSTRLEGHHCKMVCPRCGYFMSCSEFE